MLETVPGTKQYTESKRINEQVKPLKFQVDLCRPASFSSPPPPSPGWTALVAPECQAPPQHWPCPMQSSAHSPDGEASSTDVDGLHEATGLQLAQDLQGWETGWAPAAQGQQAKNNSPSALSGLTVALVMNLQAVQRCG